MPSSAEKKNLYINLEAYRRGYFAMQRTNWTVHNIKRLIDKIGENKRISSAEFNSDGDWFVPFHDLSKPCCPCTSFPGFQTCALGIPLALWFPTLVSRVPHKLKKLRF
jgi:hypothetical protein